MSSSAGGEQRPFYRYHVVIVLSLIYMVGSIDRTLISVLAEPIKHEFQLSDSELGVLTGLVFAISYSLAGIPIGLLLDRVSRTRMLALLVMVWSSLTAVSGFAQSWTMLALSRIGVGVAESGASPASMSLITDYFPKEKRGLAMSIFYASAPIGVSIGFIVGGYISMHIGWREAFFIAGIPGVLLSLLLLFTVREPMRGIYDGHTPRKDITSAPLRDVLATLWRIRPLLYLLLAMVTLVVAQAGLAAFASPFLIRVHGADVQSAGFALGVAKGVGGLSGVIVGGIVADRMARRSLHAGPFAVGVLMLFTGPFAMIAYSVGNLTLAVAFIAIYGFFNATYYGATFATYMTLAPVAMRGALGGLLAVAGTLVGYGMGPSLTGGLSDYFASMGLEDPLRAAMLVTATLFLVGAFFFFRAASAIRDLTDAAAEDGVTPTPQAAH